ncbi:MAG: HEAT repeat domain-containing protein [Planctomycetales bacterium]
MRRAGRLFAAAGLLAGIDGCGGDVPAPPASPAVVTAETAPPPTAPHADPPAGPRPTEAQTAFRKLVGAQDAEAAKAAEKRLDELGADALPAYVEGLSGDEATRQFAAMRLAQLGIDAAPAADALVKALADPSPVVRVNAGSALSILEDARRAQAVPVLAKLLDGQPEYIARTAAIALGNFEEQAAEAVPALGQALSADDAELRKWAASTLGRIGPPAQAAAPALEKLAANDEDAEVRAAAREALERLRPKPEPPAAEPA